MDKRQQFEHALKKTEIVRPVKRTLYTFSSTPVNYDIVTQVTDRILVEIRHGKIVAEKPAIIAPASLMENYIEGFDEEQAEYIEMMLKKFGLRALRYKYRNETRDVKLLSGRIEGVLERIQKELNNRGDTLTAVIKGVPGAWGVSLMKCVIQMIAESFPGNVKELEERGWFHY